MQLISKKLAEETKSVITRLYHKVFAKNKSASSGDFLAEKFDFGYPPGHSDADYATSIALKLAKPLRKEPNAIAEEIVAALKQSKTVTTLCERVQVRNGFINFQLKDSAVLQAGSLLLGKGAKGFLHRTGIKKRKILNEFISANPTGPIHMGNARGAFLGDILSRVFKKVGHDVTNEFYINDAKNSKQIQELGRTFLGRSQSYLTPWLNELIHKLKDTDKIARVLLKISDDRKEAGFLLASEIQKYNKHFITEELGVPFDNWFSENIMYEKHMINSTMAKLEQKGLVYEKEGAKWMKTAEYGDDEDRVLVRSDGDPTYFLADITYHLEKYSRGYDEMIDIWGADHQGHVKRLHAALRAVGKDDTKLNIIITQFVRLVEKGETAKMSKRAGMYVTLEELVGEVGLDVARFFFLMRSPETHIDFDLDLAREKSDKNPVYYVQYARVRAASILNKVGWTRIFIQSLKQNRFPNEAERALLIQLLRFPEIIVSVAESYHVHQLTSYATDLARAFHTFYEKSPVLNEENKTTRAMRVAMCKLTRNVLDELFELMGISSPEKM